MTRAVIVGSGSEIAPTRVTNAQMARIMDTSDEWIRERSGVEQRHFATPDIATSDLGVAAAAKALAAAGVAKEEVDLVVFATMTPDHYFPGCGTLLQHKLGLRTVPCFDIRQQCSGFLYGLQLADAHVRAGLAKTVLLVGAEVHIGFMPWTRENYAYALGESDVPPTKEEWDWNSRFRHLVGPLRRRRRGRRPAGGRGRRPGASSTTSCTGRARTTRSSTCPAPASSTAPTRTPSSSSGATTSRSWTGATSSRWPPPAWSRWRRSVLQKNGVAPEQLKLVLMHQANKRINEYCAKSLGLREDQVPHNIHKYGNTTAATIPLLWDECVRDGRLQPGDLVLMVAFGAGMTWGASLVRA